MGVGRFVSFEGIDGSGKSTQARMLADALKQRGLDVHLTREPGGTPLGDEVRTLLLHTPPGSMGDVAEACLFAASRAELVRTVVEPRLAAGQWVVCDRFVDSSLAYQGMGRGLGTDVVWSINRASVAGRMPDLTVLVDTDEGVAAARRCAGPDRIEAEGHAFQARVRRGFLDLAAAAPERFVVVDGAGAPDDVHAAVMAAVEART